MPLMKPGSVFDAKEPELVLLGFGMSNTHRVFTLDEIATALPQFGKDAVEQGLDHLALSGLLTRLAGRYCFNRNIPSELRLSAKRSITSTDAN